MDENTKPKEKYIPFHRERQEPIDKYSRKEVDKKLRELEANFDKKIEAAKIDVEKQRNETLMVLHEKWKEALTDIKEKLKNFYGQEKVDTFFNVIQQRCDNMETIIRGEQHQFSRLVSFEKMIKEYLIDVGQGKIIDGQFVFKPKKRKRWRK